MNKMLNLSEINDDILAAMNHDRIDYNKLRSKLSNKSRLDSKSSRCFYCSCDMTKFCNSHSVPASFLKNIAVDGKIFTNNKIIDLPLFDTEKGVNNSGTFRVICKDCDSKIFQEYENPDNYEKLPTSKMIAQIAMKNYLRSIDKRQFEISLYRNIQDEVLNASQFDFDLGGFMDQLNKINNLDLKEYIKGFKRAKKITEKGWKDEYYLFFHEKLDYVVPVAFQSQLALHFDFKGNEINDVYNESDKYDIQSLHVSVFPLKTCSIIMLFIDKKDKRYRAFYKQFSKLSKQDKLSAVNYIIFSLSEDVYMNKDVHDSCINDDKLKEIAGLTSVQFSHSLDASKELIKESFDFSHMNMIPNLLLENIKENPSI